jgi:hypothetical protein
MITIPTSTITLMMANATGTLSSSGMLALLGVVLGVPFAFWVIESLIAIVRFPTESDIARVERDVQEQKKINR